MSRFDAIRSLQRGGHRRAAGFTIIEVMVAVAILAIILGIAIPSYNQWVLEAGRADGKAVLFQTAQVLERCYTRYSAYNDGDCSIANGDTVESEEGKYSVTVRSNANTFALNATPQGGQAEDDECMTLTLNSTGARGITGGATGTVEDCW